MRLSVGNSTTKPKRFQSSITSQYPVSSGLSFEAARLAERHVACEKVVINSATPAWCTQRKTQQLAWLYTLSRSVTLVFIRSSHPVFLYSDISFFASNHTVFFHSNNPVFLHTDPLSFSTRTPCLIHADPLSFFTQTPTPPSFFTQTPLSFFNQSL